MKVLIAGCVIFMMILETFFLFGIVEAYGDLSSERQEKNKKRLRHIIYGYIFVIALEIAMLVYGL